MWLDVAPYVLAARVGAGSGRPLLEVDPAGTLKRLDARRRPVYRELSDVVLSAGTRRPAELAEDLVRVARAQLDAPTDGRTP